MFRPTGQDSARRPAASGAARLISHQYTNAHGAVGFRTGVRAAEFCGIADLDGPCREAPAHGAIKRDKRNITIISKS
jgi:hypothetical protein